MHANLDFLVKTQTGMLVTFDLCVVFRFNSLYTGAEVRKDLF